MASRSTPLHNPAGHAGLSESFKSLISSLTRFFESRAKLALRESKDALLQVVVMFASLVCAVVFLSAGYLLLVTFAIGGIARLLGVYWIWVVLVASLLHLAVALFCLVIARAKAKRPYFQDTAMVLKEDSEWLKHPDQAKAQ